MKAHGLLLDRHAGGVERRHDATESLANLAMPSTALGPVSPLAMLAAFLAAKIALAAQTQS
jgi:hypothetical protein